MIVGVLFVHLFVLNYNIENNEEQNCCNFCPFFVQSQPSSWHLDTETLVQILGGANLCKNKTKFVCPRNYVGAGTFSICL